MTTGFFSINYDHKIILIQAILTAHPPRSLEVNWSSVSKLYRNNNYHTTIGINFSMNLYQSQHLVQYLSLRPTQGKQVQI
jgi:hypothetical protein